MSSQLPPSSEASTRPARPRRVLLFLGVVAVGAVTLVVLGISDRAKSTEEVGAWANEQAVQTAFREVSDALSNVERASSTEGDLAQRVRQAEGALRLATQRYEAGYSAYLEVLDAQRTLNDAQLALMRNRLAFLAFTVDLMSALGGGWSV